MARVTVEDCILNVPNRFDLVIYAAQRAKQISSGNPLTLDRDNDKDAVVALREIAEKTVGVDALMEETIQSFSKRQNYDTVEAIEKQNAEIQETFEEAKLHLETPPKVEEDDDDEGDAEVEGEPAAETEATGEKPAFGDDNVVAED